MKNNNIRGKAKKRTSTLLIAMLFTLLSISLASARIDLASPENNTYTGKTVSFDYYVSFENTTVNNCSLKVGSSIKSISRNITNPGFNSFTANMTEGSNEWSITCKYKNLTETSEKRVITADTIEPTIVLFSPPNNSQINSTAAEISFVALDNLAENINCDIMLNDNINQAITANNSQPATATLTALETGEYTYSIKCYDYANNSKASETRTFRMEAPPEQPSFDIVIPGTEFETGDNTIMTINAPQGTSIRVEVCPDTSGFVECKVPVNAQNIMNYPFDEYLPFTNYEGKYLLEAFFNYTSFTETKTLAYEVKNNIKIDIDTDDDQRRNVPVILDADAKGGVGKLNYTWHLSDGSTKSGKKANITYTTAGEYANTISVKDEYNNTKNNSITITVDNTYTINIIVKDSLTGAVIPEATVDVDDEEKETGTNGQATYYLTPGDKDIFIVKNNYTVYRGELSITKDETLTFSIEPVINNDPVITLISPENNSLVTGTSTELVFKAEYNKSLNCSTYINEQNDGFFAYLGSLEVTDASQRAFGVIELENKSYWWKVECIGTNGKSAMSSSWMFNVGGEAAATQAPETPGAEQSTGNFKIYDDWEKELYQVLDNINSLPKDEKDAADALGIQAQIEESITAFKNTVRDLDSLNFRTDLADDEKLAMGEEIVQSAEQAYQKAPISIELLNKEAFAEYIKPEEIEALLDQYLELTNTSTGMSKKELLKFINELQQEVLISSKVKIARITYRDGSQSDASIIFREIKAYNITDNTFIMEIIPKDVAENAGEVKSSQEYDVFLQDPIIKFALTGDTTISYYLEASRDIESLKKIKTIVLVDPSSIEAGQKITGFAISNLKLPEGKGIIFIPVLIILLGGLIFAGIRYDGINTAKYLAYKIYGKKSLHYISVILNEIHDNIDTGDFEKAVELYDEARGAYSELSTLAKNDVYEQICQVATRVQDYHAALQNQNSISEMKSMVSTIQAYINNGQISPALEEYKKIEAAYTGLDDETRELLHPTLVSLGNKIQIMIENSKNLI